MKRNNYHLAYWFCCSLSAAALLLEGCSQPLEVTYVARPERVKLPPKHQRQVGDSLVKFYGTPANPRLAIPAEDDPVLLKDTVGKEHLKLGAAVYRRQCALCHGISGDGNGEAAPYLNPLPRDYRRGKFKFTSTVRESKPRRSDLVRVIRYGAKGTSMPAFRWMPDDELSAVIDYVVHLSQRGELELALVDECENSLTEDDDLDPVSVNGYVVTIAESWTQAAQQVQHLLTVQPQRTPETVRQGAQAFVELNCYKCHGKDGHGNREFDVGKDAWGRTAYAADLSSGMLHGGRRSEDLYRRIFGGITGTPMPGSNVPDSSKGETLEQRSETIWHLTHFIRSIVEGQTVPMDVIEDAIEQQRARQSGSSGQPGASSATSENSLNSGSENSGSENVDTRVPANG